jgi:hypothetical protein
MGKFLRGKAPGERRLARRVNGVSRRQAEQNKGSQLICPPSEDIRKKVCDLDMWNNAYFKHFSCHPSNSAAIDRFLALAQAKGIRVFWLLPPYLPAAQERIEASGIDAEHTAFVRRSIARYPGVTVVDARRAISEETGFFDPHHLAVLGALALSLALGDVIHNDLIPPERLPARDRWEPARWVTLSGVRPIAIPPTIETTESSMALLDAISAPIRR